VIEFLWASLALFDDPERAETATLYPPRPFELYSVAEARDRILRRLAEIPEGAPLERLLPEAPINAQGEARTKLRRRSAWASSFLAGLELAKQGDVVMRQRDPAFTPIQVTLTSVEAAACERSHTPPPS
jgi:segregation and condensation protein A